MAKNEKKDWSQEVSGQIAVCKTDKTLLELWDSLKPASELFPAHIHAAGEKTVSVYANISPEEARYVYSALFCHLPDFAFSQDKIFEEPDEKGYSIVTKLQIARYDVDQKGNKRNYPWYVEIQNGAGVAVRNANGGRYCKKDSYVCHRRVRMFLSDRDTFVMFCRADSYIRAFEVEYAFRQNRVGNFGNLFHLLNKEIQKVVDLVQFYGEGDGLRKVS